MVWKKNSVTRRRRVVGPFVGGGRVIGPVVDSGKVVGPFVGDLPERWPVEKEDSMPEVDDRGEPLAHRLREILRRRRRLVEPIIGGSADSAQQSIRNRSRRLTERRPGQDVDEYHSE